MSKYDVVIVGAGPAGIFTALTLIEKKPDLKILMIEKGKSLKERSHSKREDLTSGWAGAGAFSDGKIIYSLDKSYGGNLQDYVHDINYFQFLMDEVDKTYMKFSTEDIPMFGDDLDKIKGIKLKAARNGMSLLLGRVRHCGTDQNEIIMKNMYDYLKNKIDIKFEQEVKEIEKIKDGFIISCFGMVYNEKNEKLYYGPTEYESKYLVLVPGRSGNNFYEKIAKKLNISTINNSIDIGVRIEIPNWVGRELDEVLYEPKILIRTPRTDLKTRTFCYNPDGFVVQESIKGNDGEEIVTVNGHSNSENGERSQNTNFALLVSSSFTYPFNEPTLYGHSVARLCNLLANGGVLV